MQTSKTSPLYLTRFIAAYLVLIYHYGTPALLAALPASKRFGEPVNYFFFISGFVMIISNAKNFNFDKKIIDFSMWDFWLRRIARIYPMYLLSLFLFVLFNYTASEIDSSIPKRIWLELIGIQRWIYDGSINFPAWTVSCEFFFYFLFPFSLPLLVTKRLMPLTLLVLAAYIASILFSFYFESSVSSIWATNNTHIVHVITDSILLHPIFKYTIFLFGCLCGRYYLESNVMSIVQKYSVLIALLSLSIIMLFYRYGLVKPIFLEAGLLCVAYFPFVLALCSLPTSIEKILSNQLFFFLGEISYGIYIMQAPVEHYFEYLFTNNKKFEYTWQFLAYTVVLIGVCTVLYYLFEMPMRKIILRSKPRVLVAAH